MVHKSSFNRDVWTFGSWEQCESSGFSLISDREVRARKIYSPSVSLAMKGPTVGDTHDGAGEM